jgi:hypothetical protein
MTRGEFDHRGQRASERAAEGLWAGFLGCRDRRDGLRRRAVQAHLFEAQRQDLFLLLPADDAIPQPRLRSGGHIRLSMACWSPKCDGGGGLCPPVSSSPINVPCSNPYGQIVLTGPS